MNMNVFSACLFSFFVTNAVADPIYIAEFADGSAKFYAYPDTFTVYSDGYGALVEKRVNGKAQTRIYYSISKESCAARSGNLMSREHSMDKWNEDSKVSFKSEVSTVGDVLAALLCNAGSTVTAKKVKM